jgi:prepilin-type N-terminal cleavage/methylation domain-containing protein
MVTTTPETVRSDRVQSVGRAFTLIELMIVISVLGILASLLIPAVMAAREASRRMQCAANLAQLGIALHAYYSVHDMFPPSQLKTKGSWSRNRMSELTFLLPYLDQTPIYDSVNMSFANIESPSFPTKENSTGRNTVISVFLCPSDGRSEIRNSYRFNHGRFGGQGPLTGFDGPFCIQVLPTYASITDGLANTAFVSERLGGSFQRGINDLMRDIKHPNLAGYYTQDSVFIPDCLSAPATSWGHTAGRYWLITSVSDTYYNHNGQPNDHRPTCTSTIANDSGFGLNPPRSNHGGLVELLCGDGHVQVVLDSISPLVWIALGTRAAGDY